MTWRPTTAVEVLGRAAAAWPGRPALSFDGQEVSYRTLDQWSDRLAAAFLRLGIGRAAKVATLMLNNAEWVAIFFALAKIGAAVVPVNYRSKAAELAHILNESDAAMLIAVPRYGDRDRSPIVTEALASARVPTVVTIGDAPRLAAPRQLTWEEFAAAADDDPAVTERLAEQAKEAKPDDLWMIQFTSGTTAAPKGVELRQDQLLRSAAGMSERLGLAAGDRFFSAMPFFHIGGSTASVLTALLSGATLYFAEHFDARRALATIAGNRCTCVCGVETMFVDMLALDEFRHADLSSVRTGWTNYNETVFARLPMMMNIYALTECSSMVTMCRWTDSPERRRSGGYPLEGIEVRIVDPETRRNVPKGTSGLILVRGWCVTRGYYRQPAVTAQAMMDGGWYDTGDFGRFTEDGDLLYLGRYKDVLRVGGENVSSVEVEGVINSHPAVLRCAVVPVPHPRLSEVPLAFVLLREGMAASSQDLMTYCAHRLAGFKVPRHVVFVSEFPMTESGKIRKSQLVAQARTLANEMPLEPGR